MAKMIVLSILVFAGSALAMPPDVKLQDNSCIEGIVTDVIISQSSKSYMPNVVLYVRGSDGKLGSMQYVGNMAQAAMAYVGAVGKKSRLCKTAIQIKAN